MAGLVYLGGLVAGQSDVERVSEAFGEYFSPVYAFTHAHAVANPRNLRRAVAGNHLGTHSSGIHAARRAGVNPDAIHAFSPPLPSNPVELATGLTFRNGSPIDPEKLRVLSSSLLEFTRYGLVSLSQIWHILNFDSIRAAESARRKGIKVDLTFTSRDIFHPNDDQRQRAGRAGVILLELAGVHNQLPMYPEATLVEYHNKMAEVALAS